MKLIYLANARIPTEKAHGLQIMKMCEAFVRQGWTVELLLPSRINPLKRNPFEFYNIESKFQIKKIWCLDLIPLRLGGFFVYLQTFLFLLFAKIYLMFQKYDLLYTREVFSPLFFKNCNLELHAYPKYYLDIFKFIFDRAARLVVLTKQIRHKLIELEIPKYKILVSPDAVDMEEFTLKVDKEVIRKRLKLPADKFLVGYIGMLRTMGMDKGLNLAIKAISELPEVILVIVGGSKQDIHEYKKLAKTAQVAERIIFTGFVEHSSIPHYLKTFDLAIAPFPFNEHYAYNMSPLKIFEYMAANLPIIASDLPALREVLNQKNSILVKPDSKMELKDGILKIMNNKRYAQQIASQALKDIKHYTWQARTKKISEFIDQ